MKCNLYSITKPSEATKHFVSHYQKQCKQFGSTLEVYDIFNKDIALSQKTSKKSAQQSYTKAFLPYLSEGINFALHPEGKALDSLEFSKLFLHQNKINFFIGGSCGFEEEFLSRCKPISLSSLTMSHKIIKIVMCEQIYRALSIINHHPYHK